MPLKKSLLVEGLLLLFIAFGIILSVTGFFAYGANLQDFSAILFLASVAVWLVFVGHRKRWSLLPAMLFQQTRQRLTNQQKTSLIKEWVLTIAEVAALFLVGLTLVKACYRHLLPVFFYYNEWYVTLFHEGLLLALILVPVVATHFILRRSSRNTVTSSN